jgi:tetratricopeptide (TPR) repeat protein
LLVRNLETPVHPVYSTAGHEERLMKDSLPKVRDLFDARQYDDAFSLAEQAEKSGTASPALLVWKSRSFQMSEHPTAHIDEVETWLQQALEIDDEYLPALIELAYFYLNVADRTNEALPLFKKAHAVIIEAATETIIGLGECISEIDSPAAALKFLEENTSTIDTSRLQELKTELEGYL